MKIYSLEYEIGNGGAQRIESYLHEFFLPTYDVRCKAKKHQKLQIDRINFHLIFQWLLAWLVCVFLCVQYASRKCRKSPKRMCQASRHYIKSGAERMACFEIDRTRVLLCLFWFNLLLWLLVLLYMTILIVANNKPMHAVALPSSLPKFILWFEWAYKLFCGWMIFRLFFTNTHAHASQLTVWRHAYGDGWCVPIPLSVIVICIFDKCLEVVLKFIFTCIWNVTNYYEYACNWFPFALFVSLSVSCSLSFVLCFYFIRSTGHHFYCSASVLKFYNIYAYLIYIAGHHFLHSCIVYAISAEKQINFN